MKKILILTEDIESPPSDTIRAILENGENEVQDYNIWRDPMGDINPSKFDLAVTCLPKGHTKLPNRMEVFMATIAGMPDIEVRCFTATYSVNGDLSFHEFKSGVEYRPDKGKSWESLAFLAEGEPE